MNVNIWKFVQIGIVTYMYYMQELAITDKFETVTGVSISWSTDDKITQKCK